MKLVDRDIRECLSRGKITISPSVQDEWIGPISVDLSLGPSFLTFRHSFIPCIDFGWSDSHIRDLSNDLMERTEIEDGKAFYLQPGEFALGATREVIQLPDDIAGWLDGRSSLARLGLLIHATAHTLEPGWKGCLTLEFFNAGKIAIALRPGMRICAVSFDLLSSSVVRSYATKYGAKYLDQDGPVSSRIDLDT